MIKIKFIIVALTLIITSCSTTIRKNGANNLTDKTMEKFDIREFKNKNIKDDEIYSEIKNDTVTEIGELNDIYLKNTHKLNSSFVNKKTYYKDNYQLKAEVNYFHMFPIGISKKYDLDGKVIETKNWDEKYSFSVDELIDKMKNDFGFDLINTSNIGVDRYYDDKIYIYRIIIPQIDMLSRVREIKIDGSNGNIISDTIIDLQKH